MGRLRDRRLRGALQPLHGRLRDRDAGGLGARGPPRRVAAAGRSRPRRRRSPTCPGSRRSSSRGGTRAPRLSAPSTRSASASSARGSRGRSAATPTSPSSDLPGRVGLVAAGGRRARRSASATLWSARRPARRRSACLLVALALATPVGLVIYSQVGTGIFAPRNLTASIPAACLVAGWLLARLPARAALAAGGLAGGGAAGRAGHQPRAVEAAARLRGGGELHRRTGGRARPVRRGAAVLLRRAGAARGPEAELRPAAPRVRRAGTAAGPGRCVRPGRRPPRVARGGGGPAPVRRRRGGAEPARAARGRPPTWRPRVRRVGLAALRRDLPGRGRRLGPAR